MQDEFRYSADQIDLIIAAVGNFPESEFKRVISADEKDQLKDVLNDTEYHIENYNGEWFHYIPRREALEGMLFEAVWFWGVQKYKSRVTNTTPKQRAKLFSTIQVNAEKLLQSLGTPEGQIDDIPDELIWGGLADQTHAAAGRMRRETGWNHVTPKMMLSNALGQVVLLRKWAKNARIAEEYEGATARDKRHQGDLALKELIGAF